MEQTPRRDSPLYPRQAVRWLDAPRRSSIFPRREIRAIVIDELIQLRDTLAPRYLLAEEIGRGGMATVYRARDTKHDRDVAVKVLDPSLASAIGLERFQREIAIAAALQHPNIVPLYDSGGSGSVLYFIMPLISGESLRQRMRREAQLPLPDALTIVRDVAAALTYAHNAGVVHRDIKPENILLSGGKAMVTDFGIARAVDSAGDQVLTELGVALGTPAYMSPEQAGGSEFVDGRADTYALGCVLYEMLAGEPPFTGRTAQALLARHLHETPPSLQVVRPTVTHQLQQAVEKALAKVPADRFTSANGFADALDAAQLASISGSARVAQVRRSPARLVVGIATVAAVALFAAQVALGRDPSPDPNRVVVYPLSVPGAGAQSGAGEEAALMIQSVLEHTEPLRWLDGQALLGSSTADARILGSEASRLTRRAGARYYLAGALVTDRDTHTVILRLHDALEDSLVGQESATGATATTSPPQLAMRAVAQLLPRLLPPNGRVDVSYIADRNAAAVADWLQGEREYARSRYSAAMRHLNRALERDSSLGPAALRGALATTYLQDYAATRNLLEVAFRHEAQLPRHHLALARGLRHFVAGEADSAMVVLAEASRLDSTWSEPWMLVAETNLHLMPSTVGDSVAEQNLTTALRLQPGFAPALFHLAEFSARRGDRRRSMDLMRQIQLAKPDSDVTFQADLMVRCAFEGPDAIDWQAAVRQGSSEVVDVARILGGGGVNTRCARRAVESVLAYDTDTSAVHGVFRWSALKGLNYLTMMEGRDSAAVRLLDSVSKTIRAAVSLHVFNAAAGSRVSEAQGESAIRSLLTGPVNAMATLRLRYVSLWAWHRRDAVRLDSVVQRMRVIADSTRLGVDQLVLDGAEARLALLRADTTAALDRLKAMRTAGDPSWITWDVWESAANERLLLSELLLATGDAAGAWQTAQAFDSPGSQVYQLYLPASLGVRLRAARQLGRGADRARMESRLRALGRADLVVR
jgi:tRNA A-37 threonylcarbamoyl transferase component Bud32/tetratricopeptide (TPR) repeat protein